MGLDILGLDILCFTVVAAPDHDKRQNSLFGNCAPSCGRQIRLSDGCSGTLEVLSRGGLYGTATDRYFGPAEARVACRQLGCLRENTEPVRTNTRKGINNIFQGFGFRCNGNESVLSSCRSTGAYVSREYGIALKCGAASIFGFSAYIFCLVSAIVAAYFCM